MEGKTDASSAVGAEAAGDGGSAPPATGKRMWLRRLVMGLLPPIYAILYVVMMMLVWRSVGLNVSGDAFVLCCLPLVFVLILSIPSLIGAVGRIGPFVFSWGITLLASGIVMLMMLRAENACGVCFISFFFLTFVLILSVVTSAISGAYLVGSKIVRDISKGGVTWTHVASLAWLLVCSVILLLVFAALNGEGSSVGVFLGTGGACLVVSVVGAAMPLLLAAIVKAVRGKKEPPQ